MRRPSLNMYERRSVNPLLHLSPSSFPSTLVFYRSPSLTDSHTPTHPFYRRSHKQSPRWSVSRTPAPSHTPNRSDYNGRRVTLRSRRTPAARTIRTTLHTPVRLDNHGHSCRLPIPLPTSPPDPLLPHLRPLLPLHRPTLDSTGHRYAFRSGQAPLLVPAA